MGGYSIWVWLVRRGGTPAPLICGVAVLPVQGTGKTPTTRPGSPHEAEGVAKTPTRARERARQVLPEDSYFKLLEFLTRDDPRIVDCRCLGCEERNSVNGLTRWSIHGGFFGVLLVSLGFPLVLLGFAFGFPLSRVQNLVVLRLKGGGHKGPTKTRGG